MDSDSTFSDDYEIVPNEKLIYVAKEAKIYSLSFSTNGHQGRELANFFLRLAKQLSNDIAKMYRIVVQVECEILIRDFSTGQLRCMNFPPCAESECLNRLVYRRGDGFVEIASIFNSLKDVGEMVDLLLENDVWITKLKTVRAVIYVWMLY